LLRFSIASTKLISKSTVELSWPIKLERPPTSFRPAFRARGQENKPNWNDEAAVWQLTVVSTLKVCFEIKEAHDMVNYLRVLIFGLFAVALAFADLGIENSRRAISNRAPAGFDTLTNDTTFVSQATHDATEQRSRA